MCIRDRSGKGCPNIMGKARHKLAVGFFCLPYHRKSAFIGHNDLIDFIGKRSNHWTEAVMGAFMASAIR